MTDTLKGLIREAVEFENEQEKLFKKIQSLCKYECEFDDRLREYEGAEQYKRVNQEANRLAARIIIEKGFGYEKGYQFFFEGDKRITQLITLGRAIRNKPTRLDNPPSSTADIECTRFYERCKQGL